MNEKEKSELLWANERKLTREEVEAKLAPLLRYKRTLGFCSRTTLEEIIRATLENFGVFL